MKKKIVITGAAGGVVGRVLHWLRKEYDLVLLDVHDTDALGNKIEGIHIVDLANSGRDAYRQYFTDAAAVIHTAYRFSTRITGDPSSSGSGQSDDRQFALALEDVQMCYNVCRTAQEEGVKRVIVFSSNHAADYYERLMKKGELETITEDIVPYSDNFYGWSKVCEEALGHLFTAGISGRELEIVMLRLGAPRTDLIEKQTSDDYFRIRRNFASYLSVGDEIQLLKLCIEKEDIRDAGGLPFFMCYGTSDNNNRIWSLRNARQFLGYAPKDSAYTDYPERIKTLFTENIDKEVKKKGTR
jgi:nucleoside-diphosphate-sugar epimerase